MQMGQFKDIKTFGVNTDFASHAEIGVDATMKNLLFEQEEDKKKLKESI